MTTSNDAARKLAEDALKLAGKATPGPWGYKEGVFKHYAFSLDEQEDFGISLQEMHWNDAHEVPAAANAQFVAGSRQLVPDLATALLAALDRNEQLERVEQAARAFVAASKVDLTRVGSPGYGVVVRAVDERFEELERLVSGDE